MSVPQQKFREIVFQALYSYDIGRAKDEDIIELLMKELLVSKKVVREALEKAQNVTAIQEETDRMIAATSASYEFERIQTIERNILRLGIYEMFFDDEVPPKVAIAESIRLARKFGTPESAGFINAILDSLYKASLGQDVDVQQVMDSAEKLIQSEELAKKIVEENKEQS